ncbi:MAG: PGPGW domain-containing protein, partial [Ectothiorhodospiraceae bacterium]
PRREERTLLRHPVAGLVLLIVKNALDAVLVLAGIAMLVLPGQGVLTILAGLTLMNFPGKYRVERWLMSRPAVFNAVNWLRRRAGRPPLEL